LIINLHSFGMASTIPINLKYWIGDRFASNTLGLSRNLPVSEL